MAENKSSVAQVDDPHPPEKIFCFRFFKGDVEYLTKRKGVKEPKYESREAFNQHQDMLRQFQNTVNNYELQYSHVVASIDSWMDEITDNDE